MGLTTVGSIQKDVAIDRRREFYQKNQKIGLHLPDRI